MTRQRQTFLQTALIATGIVWTAIAGLLSAVTVAGSTASGRIVTTPAAVVGVLAAVGAVVGLWRGRWFWAGALLILSAVAPTGFAYLPNIVALAIGVSLLCCGRRLPRSVEIQ
jgi:hypothetical protein